MKKKNYIFTLDSKEIKWLIKKDKILAKLIRNIGTLKYSLDVNYFDFLVNTIIGQMLSNKASSAISKRLYDLCNNSITPRKINNLTIEKLRQIGISTAKSKYIINLSKHIIDNPNFFENLKDMDDDNVIKELIKLKGLGLWSAKMYLIFVLNRMDILPYEDAAFLQSFKWLYSTDDINKDNIINICSPWKPYSTIASRYLYIALDEGYIKG
jgi:DNA-3-methyladenine glycosylase II